MPPLPVGAGGAAAVLSAAAICGAVCARVAAGPSDSTSRAAITVERIVYDLKLLIDRMYHALRVQASPDCAPFMSHAQKRGAERAALLGNRDFRGVQCSLATFDKERGKQNAIPQDLG